MCTESRFIVLWHRLAISLVSMLRESVKLRLSMIPRWSSKIARMRRHCVLPLHASLNINSVFALRKYALARNIVNIRVFPA